MNLPAELVAKILLNLNIEQLFTLSLVNLLFYNECKRVLNLQVTYHPNNKIKSKIWIDKHRYKRIIKYYSNGNKRYELWTKKGLFHCVSKPSEQSWHKNGQVKYKAWYQNGKLYQLSGLVSQMWSNHGTLEYELGSKNNKKPDSELFLLSPYMVFRAKYVTTLEKLNELEQSKQLSEIFKKLSEKEWNKFIAQAAKNKLRYDKAMSQYKFFNQQYVYWL